MDRSHNRRRVGQPFDWLMRASAPSSGRPATLAFGVRWNQNPDPDIKRPYQWADIGVQRELRRGCAVSISYNVHDIPAKYRCMVNSQDVNCRRKCGHHRGEPQHRQADGV